jgi:CheY-like chemotaxis protein
VVDLNEVVTDVNGLLARLIGEDVELRSDLAASVHPVEADVGQLEQVIVNLAVNARDAMPTGGTLTIATANREISETDAIARQPDLEAGSYVELSVTDTGEGMDDATLRQIFEPFFTTKEEGKGTGLGLATAFGIVKQSGGHIEVESEPGRGTTFTICLPRVKAAPLALAPTDVPAYIPGGGSETILLVEDEDVVRHLEREVLTSSGYTVLDARGPNQAIELSSTYPGVIHLLLTDVVMPDMNGPELARRLAVGRPEMKVIFASGYTAEAFVQRGIVQPDGEFLAKPLTPASIGHKVRDVLDAVALERAS